MAPLSKPGFNLSTKSTEKRKANTGKRQTASRGSSASAKKRSSSASTKLPVSMRPSEIFFQDVSLGEALTMSVSIRNTSSKSITVRLLSGPTSPEFSALMLPDKPVAPGLSIPLKVTFYSEKDLKRWTDRIVLSCGRKRLEVPLIAETPKCVWHYGMNEDDLDTERIDALDFGTIAMGKTRTFKMFVENRGGKDGTIEFAPKDRSALVKFNPSRVSLQGETMTDISVECVAPNDQLGLVQIPLVAKFDDDTKKEIQAALRVVETKLSLMRPDTNASVGDSELSFQDLYFGQKAQMVLMLANNGPFAQTFQIGEAAKSADEDMMGDDNSEDELDLGSGPRTPPFYSSPNEGVLEPFQTRPVKFFFRPRKGQSSLGFTSLEPQNRRSSNASDLAEKNIAKFKEDLSVEVEETGQKLLVTFEGRAVHPEVQVSEKVLNFGSCPTNDYRDIMVTLTNNNHLPIEFNIPKIAHFSTNPKKGMLKPMETKNIRVTFSPTNLGEFDRELSISLLGGKQKIVLTVRGKADVLGKRRTIVEGIDKLPEDFEKKPKWVKNSRFQADTLEVSRQRFLEQRKKSKEQYALERTGFAELNELKKTKANKEKYNQYVKSLRESKMASVKRDEISMLDIYQNDVDMGMIPGGGLDEPIPTVTAKKSSLFLAGKFSSTSQAPGKFDPEKIIHKTFKTHPTTAEERAECQQKLTQKDLSKLLFGPKMMDFGEMTVFARDSKSFAVRNTLPHHIHVELTSNSEVVHIEPKSQVIPPMQTAGFNVEFYAKLPQSVQESIFFSVNESSKIKFVVVADAVPTKVDISAEEVAFKYDDNSLERYLSSSVTLFNRGNSMAQFQFADPDPMDDSSDDMFQVVPAAGEIEPGSEEDVRVIFTPGTQNKGTKDFMLKVKGASDDRLIKCVANLPESKVKAAEKKLEFGTVPVGMKRQKYITLKNGGKHGAVFHVNQVHSDISISPSQGRLAAGSTQKLFVELLPTSEYTYDSKVTINIRGGKRIKVDLTGKSQVPEVELLECSQDINFGSVYVGATSQQELKIKNLANNIPAVLYLDLRDHPDFYVTDANGTRITLDTPETSRITIASDFNEEDEEESDDEESLEEEEPLSEPGSDDAPQKGEQYQINVPPETALSLYVVFRPLVVEDHQFSMPLSIAGIPQASFSDKQFVASGLKPRLALSHRTVNFKSKVIQKEGVNMMPHRMILSFTNEDSKDLQWQFDEEIANSLEGVYRIEPQQGKLMRGHTAQIQIFFTPKELQVYRMELPIYLDNQTQNEYTKVTIKGAGSNPKLSFDVREIVLPVVPLGVKSRAIFQVINEGYESLELKYKLPADTSRVPIQLNFIEGKQLSSDRQSVPVEVFFESKKPMSFTAKIDFYDDENNRFSIPVTCTADNCLLTNYPYMVYNKDGYMIRAEDDQSPIRLISRDDAEEQGYTDGESSDHLSVGYTASVYSSYTTTSSKMSTNTRMLRKIFSRRSTRRLMKWLNLNVLTNPVEDLHKSLLNSNGAILFDIIRFLAGKKAPGQLTKTLSNKKDFAQALFEQYEKVLTFLRSYGALLNMVKPHHLLKYDEYRQIIDIPQVKNEERMNEQTFRYKSGAAWLITIYQVIKLFYLNRVSLKSYHSLPGMDSETIAESEAALSGSNLYSVPESILLHWITYHYNKVNREKHYKSHQDDDEPAPEYEPKRIKGFGKELANSLALSAVLESHIPSLTSHFSKLKTEPQNAGDYDHNAKIFVEALKLVRLDYPLQPSDLLQANPRDTLLLCMYLYLNLPQYVPKTTITFVGNLQQTIEKSIELANPTKHNIEYDVELDTITETAEATKLRQDEFRIFEKHILLEPKSTLKYRIASKPRFSTPPGQARLTLHAKRNGVTKPETMVFLLKNKVKTDKFQKQFELESTVLETQRAELEIYNPFERSGLFKIQIQQWNNGKPKRHSFLPDPFWFTNDHVNIKAKDKKKLNIFYLPFTAGLNYHAKLLFSDPKVGEFVYALKGTSLEPESSSQMLKVLCEANEQETREISLPAQNPVMDRAFQQLRERNRKYRFTANDTTKLPEEALKKIKYKVFYSSRYFTGPSETIIDRSKPNDKCALPVTFKPKSAGVYPCTVKLVSDFDFRVLEIEGSARSPGVNVALQFSVPARKKVIQEIPITNSTDQPWKIECSLSGDDFSGPKDLRVPPQKSANYPLVFFPKRMGKAEGELVLQNPETLEKYIYTLNGDVEEPLAQDKIELECMAREEIQHTVNVPNIHALVISEDEKKTSSSLPAVSYTVEVDLPFVECEKSIRVEGESKELNLNIAPPLGGHHSGIVTFTVDDGPEEGEQIWFMIDIQAERSPPEQELVIEANVREAAVAEINISNPLDRSMTFEVIKDGTGLVGEDFVSLEAQESSVYELIYSPLLESEEEGFVSFYNESVGEFWYHLTLIAKPSEPVQLPEMRSEIGKKCEHKVKVENPIDQTIMLSVACDNDRNFAVDNNRIELLPYETMLVPLKYYPSSIDQREEATIRLHHKKAGEWIFHATGVGMRPTQMDPVEIYSEVKHTASHMLSFRNPFREKKRFTVELRGEQSKILDNTFKLLIKPSKRTIRNRRGVMEHTLAPFSTLHIPMTFSPMEIGEYGAQVVIQSVGDDNLQWVYPIRGITQIVNKAHSYYLNTKSRTRIKKIFAVPLEGLMSADLPSGTKFSHEVHFEENEYEKAIKRALILNPIRPDEENTKNSYFHTLYFEADYAPFRPFDGTATLKIQRDGQGGIWSFDIQMTSTPPDIDDSIDIEAAMRRTTTVSFRLKNAFARTATFEAYFTPESPLDFSVDPEKGILPAKGYEGSQFNVTYTASEYGKPRQGILVIDTKEMQWRYMIRGSLPPTIRSPQKSRIQNKLSSQTRRALDDARKKRTKNIIAKNILSTAQTATRNKSSRSSRMFASRRSTTSRR